MRDATRVVHAGLPEPTQGAPLRPGPVFASTYHLSGDPGSSERQYGRFGNDTWTHFETAVGELEGGEAVAFASGMAAVAAVLGTTLRPGDVLVLPNDCYYTTRQLAEEHFGGLGVEVRMAPTAGAGLLGHLDRARLLWLETPTNPGLDVCDIRRLAATAHAAGTLVAVDNTTPTALGQRPLELGADFSVASDTKALTGHSDLILGHVAVRDAELRQRLQRWRTQMGAIPGPMEAWLAHRSLATLDVRLDRMCSNALALARFLAERSEVRRVRYPGLPSDPAHVLAKQQMSRFGPVVSFELPGRSFADRFLSECRLVAEATSFGGVHTTAERRARWGGDEVPPGFIRMSLGIEDPDDLVEDVRQALDVTVAHQTADSDGL